MTPDLFRKLVAKAQLAPSVHNTQPARWRLVNDRVDFFQDISAHLPAADPDGHDSALSLGAACEGLALAASTEGLFLQLLDHKSEATGMLRSVASFSFREGATEDPLAKYVETRQSWRGKFAARSETDTTNARTLEGEDCTVISDPSKLAELASLVDSASFGFLKQPAFRQELLSWMRLRRSNPSWARDGMNAEAMQLGFIERLGASFVMGPGFSMLDAIGLAAPLLADAEKTKSAAAVVLFHRPKDENPFESGRAFYRTWLRIEEAGFSACVLAALADNKDAALSVCQDYEIPKGRKLISAFRIGRPKTHQPVARARLPLAEYLV